MQAQSLYKTPAGEQAVMALYDDTLERWPIPYETLTVPTRHGDTFIIACGDESAPPLILLHGAGANSSIWLGDVADYSQHYRVYAVDLLGEPGRSAPNRPDWSSPAYAEWLEDVFSALKIDKATIIGISQGSWTALKFATTRPEHIEKLVLMCPGGVVPDRISFVFRTVPLSLLGQWGIRRIVRMIFADQPVPEGVEEITALVMSSFKPRFGVLPLFSDEEMQRLTMPVLLLGGTKDVMRDHKKISARMNKFLPDLAVKMLPGAGHALLNTTGHIMPFLADEG